MENLSHSILEAVSNGLCHPMRISRNCPSIYHLLFADGVLLFSKASASQAKVIADIFSRFASESGLNINITKSRAFYSSKVTKQKKDKITSIRVFGALLLLANIWDFPC